MNHHPYPISPYHVELPTSDLRQMIRLVKALYKLSQNPAYQDLIANKLPATARLNPGHHAVMMGYDFHLSASGPRLIEVNTNAGGAWFACLCYQADATAFPARFGSKLLNTFIDDYALFCKQPDARPKRIAIVDEHPEQQFLYTEMQVFAALFRQAGIDVVIAAPEDITAESSGLSVHGLPIDMIYNRHCDFYLETPAMQAIQQAWLNAQVCLSPNPHTYGLLADKQRMILWSDPAVLDALGLSPQEKKLFVQTIPQTRLLDSLSPEEGWRTRKQWVFKPDTGYASRGVYVGAKLTKSKFAELNPHNTLIQQYIPASITKISATVKYKTDYRLIAYRNRILGLSARLYQGQVTNLRTENGGFAKISLTKS
jgi:hypothetical protein